MANMKSAHQITSEVTQTRKMTYSGVSATGATGSAAPATPGPRGQPVCPGNFRI